MTQKEQEKTNEILDGYGPAIRVMDYGHEGKKKSNQESSGDHGDNGWLLTPTIRKYNFLSRIRSF
jgi:hypothetical protein